MTARKKRCDPVGAVPGIIRKLLSLDDVDVLLREVCLLAKEAIGAEEVSLLLVDPARRELVEHGVAGKKLRPTKARFRMREEGIVGWVASHKLPQVIADVRKDARYVRVHAETLSEAAVPIVAGDQVLGVLNFESSKRGFFKREDLSALEFLASQAAVSLRMVELDGIGRRWRDRMAALYNISRLGGGVVPLETMLQRVTDAVRLTCGGHYAAVFQGDYDREELVLLAQSSAHPLNIALGARQKFGAGLLGKAFALGQAVNAKDVRRDPMYLFKVPGVISQVCVPICVGDHCVGILDAQAQTIGEFTDDEVMFLEIVARFLAPSLQTTAAPR